MTCSVKKLAAAVFASLSLAACGDPSELVGGKFSSLQDCLSSIQSKTGLSPNPVIDKPDQVSGYLGNTERDFSCAQQSTGTQGVYWEGWYEVQ